MRMIASVGLCLAVLEGCAATEVAPATPATAPVVATVTVAPPPPAAPVVATTPPPPVAAPPPPVDPFAAEEGAVVAVARDVAAASTNVMSLSQDALPPAWANRVGPPPKAFKTHWASLVPEGKGELVATLLDVGAVTTESGSRAEVQAKLIVLSDGRVRWSTVAAREGAKVDAKPTPGLTTADPVTSALLAGLIHRLDVGPCEVAFLSGEELLSLPPTLRGELGADLPTFAQSCSIIRKHRGATWGPILEASVVILREGQSYVAVASHFTADTTSGHLVLAPIDVAPVKGSTMELAWGDPPAGEAPKPVSSAGPAGH